MKINRISIRLLAIVIVACAAGFQLKADDGIAGRAIEAQEHPELHRTAVPQTGIKAPPGKLIQPQVQNNNVLINPVPRARPQQEDYHTQQAN
jgi:hypothetical protein